MGSVYGPNLVTDSLVLTLDAGNVQSYPGSGTAWYDVVGSNDGLLTGPTFNSGNGGHFVLDGVNDYIRINQIDSFNIEIIDNYKAKHLTKTNSKGISRVKKRSSFFYS